MSNSPFLFFFPGISKCEIYMFVMEHQSREDIIYLYSTNLNRVSAFTHNNDTKARREGSPSLPSLLKCKASLTMACGRHRTRKIFL